MKNIIRFTQKATQADIQVILMGRLGMSAKCISERTGLSTGQVYSRLKMAGVYLKDYRDGVSPFSQRVIAAANEHSASYLHELKDELKRLMPQLAQKNVDATTTEHIT